MTLISQKIITKRQIEAVIKIAERCNINCSYCYMFNRGNEEYLEHPIYISDEIILSSARFLALGAQEAKVDTVKIIFHGGEPLMFKKSKFDFMCSVLESEISAYAKVSFSMQTNAMLVDDEWIDIFSRYKIGIGISIDGPKEYNDIERIDHRGRGTYDRVVKGIRKLQAAAYNGKINYPGVICVINPAHDSAKIYRHLIDELGFLKTSFLIPMDSHDIVSINSKNKLGEYLCNLFDEWILDDNPNIRIRLFREVINFLSFGKNYIQNQERNRAGYSSIITIASNGDLGASDEIKMLNLNWEKSNVKNSTLMKYLSSEEMQFVENTIHSLPQKCHECCWQNHCLGGAQFGSLVTRYSNAGGFDNPSVFCEGIRSFYSHVVVYLLSHGIPLETIEASIDHHHSPYKRPVPLITNLQKTKPITFYNSASDKYKKTTSVFS